MLVSGFTSILLFSGIFLLLLNIIFWIWASKFWCPKAVTAIIFSLYYPLKGGPIVFKNSLCGLLKYMFVYKQVQDGKHLFSEISNIDITFGTASFSVSVSTTSISPSIRKPESFWILFCVKGVMFIQSLVYTTDFKISVNSQPKVHRCVQRGC